MVEWEADRESGLAPSDALPLEMLYPLRTISSNQHHLLGTMYSNTGACEGHFTFISQPCSAATIMSFCVPSYTHTHTHIPRCISMLLRLYSCIYIVYKLCILAFGYRRKTVLNALCVCCLCILSPFSHCFFILSHVSEYLFVLNIHLRLCRSSGFWCFFSA